MTGWREAMHSLLSLRSSCLISVTGQDEMKLPVFFQRRASFLIPVVLW